MIGEPVHGRRSRRRAAGRRWAIAIVAAVALLVAACGPDSGIRGIVITNSTEEIVRVTYVVDGVERHLEGERYGDTVRDGNSAVYEFDLFDAYNSKRCTTGDIVVRTLKGREVKRLPPPVCNGTHIGLH